MMSAGTARQQIRYALEDYYALLADSAAADNF